MSTPWSRFEGVIVPLSRDQLPDGTLLDSRYEIVRKLDSGGFASVYVGRQHPIDRPVAIKLLHTPANPTTAEYFIEAFLQEARAIAQINHPGVVTVHDYGVYEGRQPYLILELLEGHSLRQELAEHGPLNLPQALKLHFSALSALSAAHDHGFVHRDLKPSNLFVTHPGSDQERLTVLDFGLAFDLDQHLSRITRMGEVRGTPQYIAPEYLEDQIVTPALDVYQMGLILVEMLSGRPVVQNKNVFQCYLTHTNGELSIPTWIRESVAGPVIEIATDRRYEQRYQDASEFMRALGELDPSLIPPPPISRPIVNVVRRPETTTETQPGRPVIAGAEDETLDAPGSDAS